LCIRLLPVLSFAVYSPGDKLHAEQAPARR
jgi:hypothetical protein